MFDSLAPGTRSSTPMVLTACDKQMMMMMIDDDDNDDDDDGDDDGDDEDEDEDEDDACWHQPDQANTWTNTVWQSIGPLGTNLCETLLKIKKLLIKKIQLKTSAKWQYIKNDPYALPFLNSLRPSEAIWKHRVGSTLAQVMACYLTAPSHYLKQHWLSISMVQWHSSKYNPTRDTSAINR